MNSSYQLSNYELEEFIFGGFFLEICLTFIYVYMCVSLYAMYVWVPTEVKRGHWIPWIQSYRQ